MRVIGQGSAERTLTAEELRHVTAEALEQAPLAGKRVLVIIPDGTRSGPVGTFFRLFHELLRPRVAALDCLIALGTHQPMNEDAICRRLDVTPEDLHGRYGDMRIFNHEWSKPETFRNIGTIPADEIRALSDGMLSAPVPVTINRLIFDYDSLIICGPVFPHEVAGFSGGNKYLFPGISGPQVIDASHWLGALRTCRDTIGSKYTPVRAVIDRAASMVDRPVLCFCMVVKGQDLAGLYVGPTQDAWSQAADLSAQVHIVTVPRLYREVLAVMPDMYTDIWTAAKGMYKLEPVVEPGGELIIYAPGITEISYTHGLVLDEIGYHVRDYFVKQWDRFRDKPWGVLAHSTHLCGSGTYEGGVECPNVRVTLATGIPRERCERLNLGYRDPAEIDLETWCDGESEGRLMVPRAGEMLYRLTPADACGAGASGPGD